MSSMGWIGGAGVLFQQRTGLRKGGIIASKVDCSSVKRTFGFRGVRKNSPRASITAASPFVWERGAFRWRGGKRSKLGAVVIAASSFGGVGGASRPTVTTSRRPMQEEESSFSDEPVTSDNIRDGENPGAYSLDFADEEALNSVQDDSSHRLDGLLHQLANERGFLETIPESRDPVQVRESEQYVGNVTDLGRELEELYDVVQRMIDEGDEDTARELMECNYEILSEQLNDGVQGVGQAAMLDVLAQLYMNMGEFDTAKVLLEKASELLKNIISPQPLLDSILEHVASMYSAIGNLEEAIPLYIQSLDIQRSVYGEDNPLMVTTMLGLAKAYSDHEEGNRSIELYLEVLDLMERSKGQEDESLVVPLTHLGHILLEEERPEEAEGIFNRAVMVTSKAYGAVDGRVGVATCSLARAKIAQGQVDDAVHLFKQGLSLMEGCSRFSADDPVVENVRIDLAEVLNYLGRDEEAQELWEEIIRIKESQLGKNDILLAPHLTNAATSYAFSKKFDKAELLFRRVLKLLSLHYGPRAPVVSLPLEMLATSLHHLGRGFEALSLARDAVSIRESHFGEFHLNTAQAYNCLAAILHGLEEDDEAEHLLLKILKIQEQELGRESPEIMLTLELLAMLMKEQGRTAELQPLLRRMQKLETMLNDRLVHTADDNEIYD